MPAGLRCSSARLAAAFVAAIAVGGCRRPEPIPRIDPTLYNWHEHYQTAETPRVHVFNTGTITVPAGLVYHGGGWFEARTLDVLAFVIEHPSKGLVVFDSGLAASVWREPQRYLGVVLDTLVPIRAGEGQDLASQMRASGLSPERVTYVVVSDLHFDHAGSVEAFPNAQVVAARKEREAALDGGWMGWYFPQDYDEVPRWLEIDYEQGQPFATFAAHHDLLGDGSVVLVDLRGHTAGSQGVVVRTEGGPVLLAGDAASTEQNWRYASRPAFAHDADAWWQQIWRIKKFIALVPSTTVVPGHDASGLGREQDGSLVVHEFVP